MMERTTLVDKLETEVVIHAGTLDRDAAQALSIDAYATVLTVPLVGDDLDVGSTAVGFFSDALELLNVVELHFRLDTPGVAQSRRGRTMSLQREWC